MKNEKRFSIPTILIMTGISLVLSVGFSYLKNKDLSRLADGCYIISIILIAYGIIDLWSPTPLSRPKDIMRGIRHERIDQIKYRCPAETVILFYEQHLFALPRSGDRSCRTGKAAADYDDIKFFFHNTLRIDREIKLSRVYPL